MSPSGKVFVIVNLALAALFVGSAASLIGTSGDYRARFEESQASLQSEKDAHEKAVQALGADKQVLQDELERERARSGQLKADLDAANESLQTEQGQNADLRESLKGIQSKLADLEQNNRSFSNRITQLDQENRQLREARDTAQKERSQAVLARNSAQEEAKTMSTKASDLERALAAARQKGDSMEAKLLAAAKQYNFDLQSFGAQPPMEGMVLDASYDGGLPVVVINLGEQKGVKPGYTFDVYNGKDFKGRIRVEVVNANTSAATILNGTAARIAQGDRIATRI